MADEQLVEQRASPAGTGRRGPARPWQRAQDARAPAPAPRAAGRLQQALHRGCLRRVVDQPQAAQRRQPDVAVLGARAGPPRPRRPRPVRRSAVKGLEAGDLQLRVADIRSTRWGTARGSLMAPMASSARSRTHQSGSAVAVRTRAPSDSGALRRMQRVDAEAAHQVGAGPAGARPRGAAALRPPSRPARPSRARAPTSPRRAGASSLGHSSPSGSWTDCTSSTAIRRTSTSRLRSSQTTVRARSTLPAALQPGERLGGATRTASCGARAPPPAASARPAVPIALQRVEAAQRTSCGPSRSLRCRTATDARGGGTCAGRRRPRPRRAAGFGRVEQRHRDSK